MAAWVYLFRKITELLFHGGKILLLMQGRLIMVPVVIKEILKEAIFFIEIV